MSFEKINLNNHKIACVEMNEVIAYYKKTLYLLEQIFKILKLNGKSKLMKFVSIYYNI